MSQQIRRRSEGMCSAHHEGQASVALVADHKISPVIELSDTTRTQRERHEVSPTMTKTVWTEHWSGNKFMQQKDRAKAVSGKAHHDPGMHRMLDANERYTSLQKNPTDAFYLLRCYLQMVLDVGKEAKV